MGLETSIKVSECERHRQDICSNVDDVVKEIREEFKSEIREVYSHQEKYTDKTMASIDQLRREMWGLTIAIISAMIGLKFL